MSYASNRDRNVPELELTQVPWPAPPLNALLTSGFEPGVFDLNWDDPSNLTLNSRFVLLGVNIYRAFDSEFGPYHRVNDTPLGSGFWRDRTETERIVGEDVSLTFTRLGPTRSAAGSDCDGYTFRTEYPIIKSGSQGLYANAPGDVQVLVNGQLANVRAVRGMVGEVDLEFVQRVDVATQKLVPQVLPENGARVEVSYVRMKSLLKTDLGQRVFYRFTSVGVLASDFNQPCAPTLVETPLESATGTSSYEVEKLDFMWREAIRRNRWILEQGGERVKMFLKKHVGVPCTCFPNSTHHQPMVDHLPCFGTGVLGGYEGPFDMIIAPDDAERRISQKDIGRTVEHTYEVWTGPLPLLAHRDFLVKINGERYSVGANRIPSNRGMVLQQHFTIGHIDERDIRYQVPVGNPVKFAGSQFAPSGPEQEAEAVQTDKANIPEERQLKGRTPVWENIEW